MTKPGNSDPGEPKDTDETVDPEPLMSELEKAPPAPKEKPVMPTAREAARDHDDKPRPRVLRIAFYLAIASGIVGLVSGIDLIVNKATLVDSALNVDTDQPLTPDRAEQLVNTLLWLYMVVVVVLGAFLALFAFKAQEGVRRARMMSVIITVVLIVFHFYFARTAYGQVGGLFAAVAIALMYIPSARDYFGPRQPVR
ncbi:MAG: hypothetical protein GEV28_28570 [Actinophytocola sp.]|uniref:hypothetical protein n=1 Tax=Actinophytocola sp. TaxID=1872138 RepID=UPI001326AEAD|nr:hypothetical protein [Actinophytocola sp.]MPZ84139.1 hypothetical protein [Actinophytocola sp.]